VVSGESLDGVASLHIIDDGPPMVHLSRRKRPEIVLFGGSQPLATPLVLFAGKEISVKTQADGQLKVSRFASSSKDLSIVCHPNLADLLRTLTKVGADYPQLLAVIQEAHRQEYLTARIVVDAIPHTGRRYVRESDESLPMSRPATGTPTLFSFRSHDDAENDNEPAPRLKKRDANEEKGRPWWGIFDMMGE
jgi:hypothetical protein